jgi:pSer/pThr/pTyr-binding forkhead associated (FHA) protein/tetratricopeptide (TPR) repeat protein
VEQGGRRSMENPVEEDYNTSNHYPREENQDEEELAEGTPVAEDPRVISKEFREMDEEEGGQDLEQEEDNPDATRAGPPISLHVIEGPDAGKKKRFKSVRMVVGRGKDVDLRLTDQSVSRRHLELIHGDNGTLLRDLGGASGTKVNDERCEERVLKHNDEIEIGRTVLKFVDELEAVKLLRAEQEAKEAEEKKKAEEEEAKKKAEEEEAKKKAEEEEAKKKAEAEGGEQKDPAAADKEGAPNNTAAENAAMTPMQAALRKLPEKKVLYIGGASIAAVVLVVIMIIIFAKDDTPVPVSIDPKEQLAIAKMQAARNAIRNGEYATAVELIEAAERLKPGIDEEGLVKAAQAEATVMDAFQAVRKLMEQGNYEEARQKLDEAPAGTTAKSDEERARLEKELTDIEVDYYMKRAAELVEARDVENLRAVIPRLPADRQPQYRQRLMELEEVMAAEALEQEKLDKTNKALAAKRAQQRRAQIVADAFASVERKFENGDYERAVLECDRVMEDNKSDAEIQQRARNLKRLIPQFASTYADAQRKVQARSLETAVRPLRKSEDLYRQIGFNGTLLDSIRGQLADAEMRAGKAAVARNDVASASNHFREALRLNPENSQVRDAIRSLQGLLEELYRRAYLEKDRDPRSAAEKFKIVINTAEETSELKKRAQDQLKDLGQTGL